ncbi:hypothetical protein SUDANB19_03228 [Streptomyces sp. enrichment culture]
MTGLRFLRGLLVPSRQRVGQYGTGSGDDSQPDTDLRRRTEPFSSGPTRTTGTTSPTRTTTGSSPGTRSSPGPGPSTRSSAGSRAPTGRCRTARARRAHTAAQQRGERLRATRRAEPADERHRHQQSDVLVEVADLRRRPAALRALLQVPGHPAFGPHPQPTTGEGAEPVGEPRALTARRQRPADMRLEVRLLEVLTGPVRRRRHRTPRRAQQRSHILRLGALDGRVPQQHPVVLRQAPERPHHERSFGLPHRPDVGAQVKRLRLPTSRGVRRRLHEDREVGHQLLAPPRPRPVGGHMPYGSEQVGPHRCLRALAVPNGLEGAREHLTRQVLSRVRVPATGTGVPSHRLGVPPVQLRVRTLVPLPHPRDQLGVGDPPRATIRRVAQGPRTPGPAAPAPAPVRAAGASALPPARAVATLPRRRLASAPVLVCAPLPTRVLVPASLLPPAGTDVIGRVRAAPVPGPAPASVRLRLAPASVRLRLAPASVRLRLAPGRGAAAAPATVTVLSGTDTGRNGPAPRRPSVMRPALLRHVLRHMLLRGAPPGGVPLRGAPRRRSLFGSVPGGGRRRVRGLPVGRGALRRYVMGFPRRLPVRRSSPLRTVPPLPLSVSTHSRDFPAHAACGTSRQRGTAPQFRSPASRPITLVGGTTHRRTNESPSEHAPARRRPLHDGAPHDGAPLRRRSAARRRRTAPPRRTHQHTAQSEGTTPRRCLTPHRRTVPYRSLTPHRCTTHRTAAPHTAPQHHTPHRCITRHRTATRATRAPSPKAKPLSRRAPSHRVQPAPQPKAPTPQSPGRSATEAPRSTTRTTRQLTAHQATTRHAAIPSRHNPSGHNAAGHDTTHSTAGHGTAQHDRSQHGGRTTTVALSARCGSAALPAGCPAAGWRRRPVAPRRAGTARRWLSPGAHR